MTKDTRPPSYPLRLPPELRQKLQEAADNGHRPLSNEIIMRLEQSFSEVEDLRNRYIDLIAKSSAIKSLLDDTTDPTDEGNAWRIDLLHKQLDSINREAKLVQQALFKKQEA